MKTMMIFFALLYVPDRPAEPNVPFAYDPNQVIEVIDFYEVPPDPNFILSGTRRVTEPDGNDVTLICTISDPNLLFSLSQPTIIDDPNDPLKKSKIYIYDWQLKTGVVEKIIYMRWLTSDGILTDERDTLIKVKMPNRKPVITG